MTIRAMGIAAAALAGLAAGSSLAVAQASRPWVDPPADLGASAPKPRVEDAKPAPVAAKPAEVEVAKEKPATEVKVEAAKAEPTKLEAPKPEQEVAEKKAPREKPKATATAASRTKVTARPQARSRVTERRAVQRPDGLVVMRMQTLQFPDGRTMTVLTRPGESPNPWADGASR